jgi:hypothetical protein
MTAFLRRYTIAVEAQSIARASRRGIIQMTLPSSRGFICKNLNLIWPTMPDFASYPVASMIGLSSPVFYILYLWRFRRRVANREGGLE